MLFPLFPLVALALLVHEDVTERVDAAIREHRTNDAVAALDQTLKIDPQWSHGWWLLGSVLYDAEKYPAAHSALERLVRIDPKSGQGWALLGLCDFESKNYGLALEHLQRGDALGIPAELDLTDVVRYHEALLLILDRRFDPAQVLLDQLVRKGFETDEVAIAQGLVALRMPLLPASLPYVAADRVDIVRRVGLAQRAIAHAKLADAIATYKDLASLNVPNLHLSYAALLLQTRDSKASERELRTELKLNPASVEARLRLCGLLESDSLAEAVSLAEEAVQLDPESFKTHFFLGKLLLASDKPAESVRELELSRDLNPSSSAVRFALVHTYNALGKKAEAKHEADVLKQLREMEDSFRASGRVPAF